MNRPGACMAALPWLKRDSVAARSFVTAIAAALMWRYIVWRSTQSLPPIALSLDTFASLTFVGVETLALIGSTISLFFLTRVRNRTRKVEANMGWLTAQPVPPLIDVFICTYNEEEAILERTMVGALAIDYPNYRLWMLDDDRPLAGGAMPAAGLRLHHPSSATPDAKAGNMDKADRARRGARRTAAIHRDPRCRFRSDARVPDAGDDAVS